MNIEEQQQIDEALGEQYDESPELLEIASRLSEGQIPMPDGYKIENDGECYRLSQHLSPAGYYRCSFMDAAVAYRKQHDR